MRKIIVIVLLVISFILGGLSFYFYNNINKEKEVVLPKPKVTGGQRGVLGIDKNVNEKTIDKYLNRKDSVYRDMRMLKDPANYEKIGGDSYLSGFIKGFEVIPFPLIVEVKNLPTEVGTTYKGKTLFKQTNDGNYVPNYKESIPFLEYYFPKDKNIFLMCGGGGYAGMMKDILVSLGWNKDKIYNVGGYWYYDGPNKIEVKKTINEKTSYDFYKITYHDIDFNSLNEVNNE